MQLGQFFAARAEFVPQVMTTKRFSSSFLVRAGDFAPGGRHVQRRKAFSAWPCASDTRIFKGGKTSILFRSGYSGFVSVWHCAWKPVS
jgi:hypothetical protein